MNAKDLINHRLTIIERIEAIEAERSQLTRKLKALDVLLEGEQPGVPGLEDVVNKRVATEHPGPLKMPRKRTMAKHAVRFSPRISLIGAVQEMAMKQPGEFDSTQILSSIQATYPEFKVSETKHISSPLSDLVKKGVLVIVRERNGSMPNIYRVAQTLK